VAIRRGKQSQNFAKWGKGILFSSSVNRITSLNHNTFYSIVVKYSTTHTSKQASNVFPSAEKWCLKTSHIFGSTIEIWTSFCELIFATWH
jgi:hypothetical protein